MADNTVWSHWQVASRSSEVNFTKNYTLLYLYLLRILDTCFTSSLAGWLPNASHLFPTAIRRLWPSVIQIRYIMLDVTSDIVEFIILSAFRILQGSVATYCRWGKIFVVYEQLFHQEVGSNIHREFSCESTGERILKIGPHLQKLLLNINGVVFYWRTLYVMLTDVLRRTSTCFALVNSHLNVEKLTCCTSLADNERRISATVRVNAGTVAIKLRRSRQFRPQHLLSFDVQIPMVCVS